MPRAKKIILRIIILLFINLIVLILPQKTSAAGSCTCNMDQNLKLYVVPPNNCSSDTVATCSTNNSSNFANLEIYCNCVVSQPGTNCVTQGLPPPGQTCCPGYTMDPSNNACIPVGSIGPNLPKQVTPVVPPPQQGKCTTESIDTAIGCIPVGNLSDFAGFFLKWGVGIGGGIAFILIIISGFMIMTASGNPERLQAGKELMTSAIMGLIMLIFSVFLLKIIGVDILQLTIP